MPRDRDSVFDGLADFIDGCFESGALPACSMRRDAQRKNCPPKCGGEGKFRLRRSSINDHTFEMDIGTLRAKRNGARDEDSTFVRLIRQEGKSCRSLPYRFSSVEVHVQRRMSGLIFALVCLLAGPAMASVLTVSGDLPFQYIGSGGSASGRFDINASAGTLGLSSPYDITGGTMTFNFADNNDAKTLAGSSSSKLVATCVTGWFGNCVSYSGYHWEIVNYLGSVDPFESASGSSGGMTGTGHSNYFSNGPYYGPLTASGHYACLFNDCTHFVQDTLPYCTTGFLGTQCSAPYPVFTETVTSSWGYTGPFSISMPLNSVAIADLNNTGLLDFSIASTFGDFYFLSASLDATVNSIPLAPTAPGAVPEPASIALVACNLGLLWFGRRRIGRMNLPKITSGR